MNKENQEQPENIEEPKEQETFEVDSNTEGASGEAQLEEVKQEEDQQAEESQIEEQKPDEQQPEEKQPEEHVSKVEEPPAEVPEVKASEAKAPEAKAPEMKTPETKETKGSGSKTATKEAEVAEIIEKVISINRITKVTKGGKKLSFSALVVVGDTRGNVGYSLSKAAEVAIAIRKAMATAKKNMVTIPMKGTTIPHEIIGKCGGSRVLLKPASDGTGVIASGPVRAICDGAGIHNILTKCHRSNNPINVVKATIDGLTRLKTVQLVNE